VGLRESKTPHPRYDEAAFAALREYAQQIEGDQPNSASASSLKVAEAGSLLEWLQERGAAKPSSTPSAPPSQPRTTATRPDRAPINAVNVGEKVCMTCHAGHAAEFSKTMMGRIASTKKTMNCETCHGPGSAHVKAGGGRGVGGIISFRPNDSSRTTEENNAICLSCHEKGDRTYWKGSAHEVRDVACTNCHTIMKNVSLKKQLKTAFEPETCFQCHKDRRAQVARSSHMPLREGKVSCTNCHNPHGSFTEALLRKNSINDTCYQCHAEKRGPFLFEHTPVRESCVNCHEPHGTLNEYSLKMSRQRLCAECHTIGHGLPSGPQAVQSIGRQCQNCHTAIHGTNSPSGALLQR
jgi:DmsE family decaheme c-type cytochrome